MITSKWLHAIAKFLTIMRSPFSNIELEFYTLFTDQIVIPTFRVSLHKRPFNYIKEPRPSDNMFKIGGMVLVVSDVTRTPSFIFGQLTHTYLAVSYVGF